VDKKLFLRVSILIAGLLVIMFSGQVFAQECPSGYVWSTRSISCIQEDCNEIPDAHYGYTLNCVCGTSGSINEKLTNPNKECSYPSDYSACPVCVYAIKRSRNDSSLHLFFSTSRK
jgi:hypothetical protein